MNLGLSSNGSTNKIYFYTKDDNGNLSNPSYIEVTRTSSYSNRYRYTSVVNGDPISGTIIVNNVVVTFNDGLSTHYYGSSKTSISGSDYSANCSALDFTVTNGKYIASLPFYTRTTVDGQYYYSETVVKIERKGTSASYAYSLHSVVRGDERTVTTGGEVTGTTSEAALVMWSSGRVGKDANNNTTYQFYWFGPMRARLDPWFSTTKPSYSESRQHYEIGYAPYGLWGVQDKPGEGESTTESNAARGAATVARCIREYDNVTTVSE
jgi:hypothetical protein